MIEKTAAFVSKQTDPKVLEKLREKQKANPFFQFLEQENELHEYFLFLKSQKTVKKNSSLSMISAYSEEAPNVPEERKQFIEAFINLYMIGGDEFMVTVKENNNKTAKYDFLYPWNEDHSYYKKRLEERKKIK